MVELLYQIPHRMAMKIIIDKFKQYSDEIEKTFSENRHQLSEVDPSIFFGDLSKEENLNELRALTRKSIFVNSSALVLQNLLCNLPVTGLFITGYNSMPNIDRSSGAARKTGSSGAVNVNTSSEINQMGDYFYTTSFINGETLKFEAESIWLETALSQLDDPRVTMAMCKILGGILDVKLGPQERFSEADISYFIGDKLLAPGIRFYNRITESDLTLHREKPGKLMMGLGKENEQPN